MILPLNGKINAQADNQYTGCLIDSGGRACARSQKTTQAAGKNSKQETPEGTGGDEAQAKQQKGRAFFLACRRNELR